MRNTARDRYVQWSTRSTKTMRVIGLLLVVALAGIAARCHAQAAPPTPGKIIDLGGYKLHLNCTGSGPRTVVIEGGFHEASSDWKLVQDRVANFARACTYDRAGYGWSDPGPMPRTLAQINLDLRRLLQKAGERGPFVLVGHSFGGVVARQFALMYPKDIAGLVLVDTVSENERIQVGSRDTAVLADFATHKPIPMPREKFEASDKQKLPDVSAPEMNIEPPYDRLDVTEQRAHLWAMRKLEMQLAEQSEREWSPEYFAKWRTEPAKGSLGNIPLVVLTRAEGGQDKNLDTPAEELERLRKSSQAKLAELSSRGRQQIVKSGHEMQLETPDVVAEAIRTVVSGK